MPRTPRGARAKPSSLVLSISWPAPSGAANKWRSMLRDNEGAPGGDINFTDIGRTVDAFKTIAYPEAGPIACP